MPILIFVLLMAQEQPIRYNHKTHLALGLKCQDCHAGPDPGFYMTFPATSKCMTCHSTIAKDGPAIKKLAAYAASKEPIPWVRIYTVPSDIFWSHRSHLNSGIKCEVCHGQVALMDRMVKARDVTTMEGCMACHKEYKGPRGCESCHEAK